MVRIASPKGKELSHETDRQIAAATSMRRTCIFRAPFGIRRPKAGGASAADGYSRRVSSRESTSTYSPTTHMAALMRSLSSGVILKTVSRSLAASE